MNLSNFGQQFASKTLRKTYQEAVFRAITNTNYEGELKKPGDRVNILSFLNAGQLGDYAVGTDMAVMQVVDNNDQLVVEKRKYYNISLDRLEDLFTYVNDIPDYFIQDQSKTLEIVTDAYVLDKFGSETKAGNWVGLNFLVTGGAATMASLVTSATGGTITVVSDSTVVDNPLSNNSVENPLDGTIYSYGFENSDLYKGIRLVSTRSIVSPWWRISSITNTVSVAITEWDEATSGPDFAEGYTLRGVFGGDGINFPKYTDAQGNDVGAWVAESGFGWEIQAAIATSVTSASIYPQLTLLDQYLDDNEVPGQDRHFTAPPSIITALKNASQLQPSGISEIFTGTVINGTVMRVGGFMIHEAAGVRVSTRAGRSTSSTQTGGLGNDTVKVGGNMGYLLPANHIECMTYADKWTESRIVDTINQFAKQYQGLYLFGAKVPHIRRKTASILFGSV